MKTIKIIDIFIKIANGEEVPTTIKYQDDYYNLIRKYNEDWEEYEFGYKNPNGGYLNIWRDNVLNDEVEIIEEEKQIPEKLSDILRVDDLEPPVDENMHKIWCQAIKNQNKINEIIDYLNSKGDE